MNLLVYSAYYEPEVAASMYLSTNLYEDFASSGMKVRLYVPLPTRGVSDDVRKSYKGKSEVKADGNLEIVRLNIPKERRNAILRALRYALMHVRFIRAAKKFNADAIFVQSTPPTQGVMAAFIRKKKKIPLIYNLQDVFPDSMVGAGMVTEESAIYKIGRKVENFTYKHSDKIIVISNDIRDNVIEKGVAPEKVTVVPNWIESDTVVPIERENNYLFEKYNIPKDKFTVVYAGNLGYAQNIEVIIRAAEKLRENKDVQFVIFGNGAQEEKYKSMAENLDNIFFFPLQPYSEVSYVYSMGDACIVSCKKGLGSSAMPSKTWSIMATATPVLASFDSSTEIERIIKEEQTGLFSEADDCDMLAENILSIYQNPQLKETFGQNARKYVEDNLNRNVCTKKYIETVMETIQCRK